ncbi:MAG: VPLPA-CTERM sorting domain-containing protein [Pseudomonadota bacterium]
MKFTFAKKGLAALILAAAAWAAAGSVASAVTLASQTAQGSYVPPPGSDDYALLQASTGLGISFGSELLYESINVGGDPAANNGPFLPASSVNTNFLGATDDNDDPVTQYINFTNNQPLGPNGESIFLNAGSNQPNARRLDQLVAVADADGGGTEFTAIGIGINESGSENLYTISDLRIIVFDQDGNGGAGTFVTVASYLQADNGGDSINFDTRGLGNSGTDALIYVPTSLLMGFSGEDLLLLSVDISNDDAGIDTYGYVSSYNCIDGNVTVCNPFNFDPDPVVPLPAAAWMLLSALGGLAATRYVRQRRQA